ncbi:hypothetical protein [Acetobacter aceti]|uniref:Uncharacterized protein n=1 Tax=Acetobacter aceti TaxID=435 RepID=A0A6S6PGE5_ACEAC|nr:hypothetical protein [Acetobacter aceti]BCI68087.1 hypothetical protein AAJCM20276_27110 [Acetobacter aceti]
MSLPETITTKSGHVLSLKEIDPGEMLDLIEAAGSAMTSGASGAWLSYASIVCTVRDIDGVPVPWPTKKGEVKALANKIGNEGIVAVQKAMSEQDGDAEVDTAKN